MRYLDGSYPDLASNLALDEALVWELDESPDIPGYLRIWELDHLAVVLGASCRLWDEVDVERCRADGVAIGRRSSGGGTVLIGPGALNVTVVLPTSAAPELRAVDTAQAFVLGRIAASLPEVEVLGSGDLTLGGRKFSGSAQRRLKRTVMVHATILRDFPIDLVSRYLKMPPRQPEYRAGRSHADFLTNLGLGRDVLMERIRSTWLETGVAAGDGDRPEERVQTLVQEKFSEPTWIERL